MQILPLWTDRFTSNCYSALSEAEYALAKQLSQTEMKFRLAKVGFAIDTYK